MMLSRRLLCLSGSASLLLAQLPSCSAEADKDKKDVDKKADGDDEDDEDDKDFAEEVDAEDSKAKAGDVAVLTDDSWQEFKDKNERVLMEFYAPWCGHCKKLEPEWDAAAKTLKEKKAKTKLAKVDATTHSKAAAAHDVKGYPTIVYYVNGEHTEYNGPREADGIVKWAMARERDPVVECKDEDVDQVKPPNEYVLVATVASKKSGKAVAVRKAVQKLIGMEVADGLFACYKFLEKGQDEKKHASLRFTRGMTALGNEDQTVTFTGKAWSVGKVYDFILKDGYYPLVGALSGDDTSKDPLIYTGESLLAAAGKQETLLFQSMPKDIDSKMKEALTKLAKANKQMAFAVRTDLSVEPQEKIRILKFKEGAKSVKYVDTTKEADMKVETLEKFVAAYKAGKLKPAYKSADPPADPYEDDVRVLTGNEFEDFALDASKDVFVEFYAPWCGHCKSLAPEWAKLAKKIRKWDPNGKKVVVAKMDATANECMEEIQSFPTLVLYPAVKNSFKKRINFNGAARKEPDLLEFLTESAENISDDVDLGGGDKIDKSQFNMVAREKAKKAKKGGKKEEL